MPFGYDSLTALLPPSMRAKVPGLDPVQEFIDRQKHLELQQRGWESDPNTANEDPWGIPTEPKPPQPSIVDELGRNAVTDPVRMFELTSEPETPGPLAGLVDTKVGQWLPESMQGWLRTATPKKVIDQTIGRLAEPVFGKVLDPALDWLENPAAKSLADMIREGAPGTPDAAPTNPDDQSKYIDNEYWNAFLKEAGATGVEAASTPYNALMALAMAIPGGKAALRYGQGLGIPFMLGGARNLGRQAAQMQAEGRDPLPPIGRKWNPPDAVDIAQALASTGQIAMGALPWLTGLPVPEVHQGQPLHSPADWGALERRRPTLEDYVNSRRVTGEGQVVNDFMEGEVVPPEGPAGLLPPGGGPALPRGPIVTPHPEAPPSIGPDIPTLRNQFIDAVMRGDTEGANAAIAQIRARGGDPSIQRPALPPPTEGPAPAPPREPIIPPAPPEAMAPADLTAAITDALRRGDWEELARLTREASSSEMVPSLEGEVVPPARTSPGFNEQAERAKLQKAGFPAPLIETIIENAKLASQAPTGPRVPGEVIQPQPIQPTSKRQEWLDKILKTRQEAQERDRQQGPGGEEPPAPPQLPIGPPPQSPQGPAPTGQVAEDLGIDLAPEQAEVRKVADQYEQVMRELTGKPAPAQPPTQPPAAPPAAIAAPEPPARGPERTTVPGTNIDPAFPVKDLVAAPKELQYKLGVNEKGTRAEDRLRGPWDEKAAGILVVWRNPADGKVYIENGHHRWERAVELGVETMPVMFDTKSRNFQEARVAGAMTNIREGRGNAFDAAKLFADAKLTRDQLAALGLDLRDSVAEKGFALANLTPGTRELVMKGDLPLERGLAIGRAELSPEQEASLLKLLAKREKAGRKLSAAVVHEIALEAKNAPDVDVSEAGGQRDWLKEILGNEKLANTLVEKATLKAAMRARLAKDKSLFGFVTRQGRAAQLARAGDTRIDVDAATQLAQQSAAIEAVFNSLADFKGPVNDALNAAAARLAAGAKRAEVEASLYDAVELAVKNELRNPTAPRVPERKGPSGQPGPTGAQPPEEPLDFLQPGGVVPPEPTPEAPAEPTRAELEAAGQASMFGEEPPAPKNRDVTERELAEKQIAESRPAAPALNAKGGNGLLPAPEKPMAGLDAADIKELRDQVDRARAAGHWGLIPAITEGLPPEVKSQLGPLEPPDAAGELLGVEPKPPTPAAPAGAAIDLGELSTRKLGQMLETADPELKSRIEKELTDRGLVADEGPAEPPAAPDPQDKVPTILERYMAEDYNFGKEDADGRRQPITDEDELLSLQQRLQEGGRYTRADVYWHSSKGNVNQTSVMVPKDTSPEEIIRIVERQTGLKLAGRRKSQGVHEIQTNEGIWHPSWFRDPMTNNPAGGFKTWEQLEAENAGPHDEAAKALGLKDEPAPVPEPQPGGVTPTKGLEEYEGEPGEFQPDRGEVATGEAARLLVNATLEDQGGRWQTIEALREREGSAKGKAKQKIQKEIARLEDEYEGVWESLDRNQDTYDVQELRDTLEEADGEPWVIQPDEEPPTGEGGGTPAVAEKPEPPATKPPEESTQSSIFDVEEKPPTPADVLPIHERRTAFGDIERSLPGMDFPKVDGETQVFSDQQLLEATEKESERLYRIGMEQGFSKGLQAKIDELDASARELRKKIDAKRQRDLFGPEPTQEAIDQSIVRRKVERNTKLLEQIEALDNELGHPFGDRDDFAAMLNTDPADLDSGDLNRALGELELLKEERAKGPATLQEAWDQFDGSGKIETVNDLVDTVDDLVAAGKAPKELEAAIDAYREARAEDNDLAGRGDMDTADQAFTDAVQRALAPKDALEEAIAPEPPAAPEPAREPLPPNVRSLLKRQVGLTDAEIDELSPAEAKATIDGWKANRETKLAPSETKPASPETNAVENASGDALLDLLADRFEGEEPARAQRIRTLRENLRTKQLSRAVPLEQTGHILPKERATNANEPEAPLEGWLDKGYEPPAGVDASMEDIKTDELEALLDRESEQRGQLRKDVLARRAEQVRAGTTKLTQQEREALAANPDNWFGAPPPPTPEPPVAEPGMSPAAKLNFYRAEAKWRAKLLDNPTEGNLRAYFKRLGQALDRLFEKHTKWAEGKEPSFDAETGEVLGDFMGGLGQRIYEDPKLLWRAMQTIATNPALRGLVGGLVGREISDDPWEGFIDGFILAAATPTGAKWLGKAIARRVRTGTWHAPAGAPKDVSRLRAYFLPSAERSIPEVFSGVRYLEAELEQAFRRTTSEAARTRLRQFYKQDFKEVFDEAIDEANRLGLRRKAKLIDAYKRAYFGTETPGQRYVRTRGTEALKAVKRATGQPITGEEKLPGTFIEHKVQRAVYRSMLGFALDSAFKNYFQPTMALAYMKPSSLRRAWKLATSPEGHRLADKVNLERLIDMPAEDVTNILTGRPRATGDKPWYRDPDFAMRQTDNMNRRRVYLGMLEEQGWLERALAGEEIPQAIEEKALSVMRKTQGHVGPMGSNPWMRGPIGGSIKPFQKFPGLMLETMIDVMNDPATRPYRKYVLALGALVAGANFSGIDFEDVFMGGRPLGIDITSPSKAIQTARPDRVVGQLPVVRFLRDTVGHFNEFFLGGQPMGHDVLTLPGFGYLDSDAAMFFPGRYPTKFIKKTAEVLDEGLGAHTPRVASTSPGHTGLDDLASLVGLRTTDAQDAREARDEASQWMARAGQQRQSFLRDAYADLERALRNGDIEGVIEAQKGLSRENRRRFLKRYHQTPYQRLLERVPRNRRREFDEQFGARLRGDEQ